MPAMIYTMLNSFLMLSYLFFDYFQPLQLKPKDPVDKIIEHTMKLKIRGPSLFDPVKLLDACPFCDAKIVKSIKASIETRSR